MCTCLEDNGRGACIQTGVWMHTITITMYMLEVEGHGPEENEDCFCVEVFCM